MKVDMSKQCTHEDNDINLLENCSQCILHNSEIGCTDETPKNEKVLRDLSNICDFNDENLDNNCWECMYFCWPIGCMYGETIPKEEEND